MFEKIVTAIEPFGYTMIILAGANLTGWVQFSNRDIVGIVVVFFGVALTIKHVTVQVRKSVKK